MTRHKIALFITLLAVAPCSVAQGQSASPAMQQASSLFQAQKWAEAVSAYEAVTKAEPDNGMAWFGLGSSLIALKKNEQAVSAFRKAVEILRGPMAMYGLASAYAQLNDKDQAFEWLNQSLTAGFGQIARLQNDPNLAGLRADPRFKEVTELANKIAKPCMHSPEARQLDFWVGEWDVQTGGQTAGVNVIERLEDGCVIMENWKAGNGIQTGKSINFYNPTLGKWRQTYVGNNRGIWEMSGEYKDGAMRYSGEVFNARGVKIMTRVTFYNLGPDRVRHTEEHSNDGGKTWNTVWDAMYVRKK